MDPTIQRSGLAHALMREAILRLKGDGVKALFLEVDSTNLAAVSLYQKLGFETVGNRPGYYKNKTPGLDDEPHSRAATATADSWSRVQPYWCM